MKNTEISNLKGIIFNLLLLLLFSVRGQDHQATFCPDTDSIICTDFRFPENWKNKTDRKITIPVKIYKTKNPNPSSPIFWLAGGPGQSNLDYNPPMEFLENHDVILVGYRGIDGSVRLDCPEMTKALRGKGKDLLSKASVDNIKYAAKACSDRLLNSGIDLNGYTMEQVLLDIDAVRGHLKIAKLNLLSGSYGTRLAQLYAKYYEEKVDKSVMIGANPPGRFVWEPEVIANKIQYYDELCQNDPYCSSKSKNLYETIDKVLKEMPKTWFFAPIDPGKVKVVTFGMLYHNDSAPKVIGSFLAAAEGDYSGIALMSLAYDHIMPEMMVWGEFLAKGMIDYDSSRNYWEEFTSTTFELGSPMSALCMDIGQMWPVTQPINDFSKLQESNVPTLILNGALDMATPHEIVQKELMPFLSNGELVVFEGLGHVADLLYKSDIKKGIKRYYLSEETSFQTVYDDFSFETKWGFPKIAKISLVSAIIGILLIGFALYKAGRKVLSLRSGSK